MAASTSLSPTSARRDSRPQASSRAFSAPGTMEVNGHFSTVGDKNEDFEHGIQVVDEDKEFKYVSFALASCTGFKVANPQ
jgi:hypothetical protein